MLAPLAHRVVLAPVASERTLDPALLRAAFRQEHPELPVTVCASVGDALKHSEQDPIVLVAGSLYLVGETLENLGLSSMPASGERSLNEWTARAK